MLVLAKLLKALNSEASSWQLAWGISLGFIVGMTPTFRLHNLIILFLVLFIRINIGTFLIAAGIFSILSLMLAGPMAAIGESLLTSSSFNQMWTAVYNTGLGQLSQFHHTLTLGSLLASILLTPIVLVISRYLIEQYREKLMAWVEKLWLVQVIKSSRVYQIYQGLGG